MRSVAAASDAEMAAAASLLAAGLAPIIQAGLTFGSAASQRRLFTTFQGRSDKQGDRLSHPAAAGGGG